MSGLKGWPLTTHIPPLKLSSWLWQVEILGKKKTACVCTREYVCIHTVHTQMQYTCLWKFPDKREPERDSLEEGIGLGKKNICSTHIRVLGSSVHMNITTFTKKKHVFVFFFFNNSPCYKAASFHTWGTHTLIREWTGSKSHKGLGGMGTSNQDLRWIFSSADSYGRRELWTQSRI